VDGIAGGKISVTFPASNLHLAELSKGCKVRGLNTGRGKEFTRLRTPLNQTCGQPVFLYNERSFSSGVKATEREVGYPTPI